MINRTQLNGKWPRVELGEVVKFLDHLRKPVTAKDREPGPYPYYGANGQQDSVADFLFDEPLVLLAEDGGHFGEEAKAIAYQVEGKTWVNNHAHVLRPTNRIDIRFLCRHLENYDVRPFTSGTTRLKLNKAKAAKIPLALPPLSEQKRIAEILDRAEALRAKRRAALALLDELTQSIFLDMFGDPVSNPKGWPTNKLSAYCDLTNGFAFRSSDYVEYSQTLNCRMSNIRPNGEFDLDYHPKYLPDSYATKYKNFALKDGDVIIAMTDMATEPKILGVPTLVATGGKSLLLNQRVGKLVIEKPNELAFSFLRQLLAQPYVKNFYRRFAGGGVQINLGKRDLLGVTLIMPPFKLQKLYEERKNGIENQKAQIRKASAELDQLFASLQHRAFRGEL